MYFFHRYIYKKAGYFFYISTFLIKLTAVSLCMASCLYANHLYQNEEAVELRKVLREIILISTKKDQYVPKKFRETVKNHYFFFENIFFHSNESDINTIFTNAKIQISDPSLSQNLSELPSFLHPIYEKLDHFRSYTHPSINFDKNIIVNSIPDSVFILVIQNIREKITNFDFSNEQSLQALKDPEKGMNVSGVPQVFIDLFHLLVDQYFNHFSFKQKANIIASLLDLPLTSSQEDKLLVFLNLSGPVVQKFFQLMGDYIQSQETRKVVSTLKENIKPFPFKLAKKTIEDSFQKPLEEIFSSIDEKPLAAATISQVHIAYLKENSQKVVVKIRRPNVRKIALREISILKSLTKSASVIKLIQSLEAVILEEVDLRVEAKYIARGKIYHKPKNGIFVASLVPHYAPTEKVLILEFAEGKNLHRCMDEYDLIHKNKGLKKLYKIWLRYALFGDSFFHADLHAGNILYASKNEKPGYRLNLIDFGSVGELKMEERRSLVKLAVGVVTKQAELIMMGFRPFENMTCSEAKEFYSMISTILKSESSIGEKTSLIINEAVKREFNFSKNYLQFNRGKVFLEEHLNRNNRAIREANLNVNTVSPTKIYIGVLLSKIPQIIIDQLFNKKERQKTILDKFTCKFAWHYISVTYLNKKIKLLPFDVCKGRSNDSENKQKSCYT